MSQREDENGFEGVFDDDEMFTQRERGGERRQRPFVSDFVRRAIENTMGSVQSTGSLSREALSYLLQQGDRGKREVVRIVAHEVGEFLRGVDLSGEIIKVLSGIQLDVSASVRFKPTADGVRPEIKSETKVQPVPEKAEAEPHDEPEREPGA